MQTYFPIKSKVKICNTLKETGIKECLLPIFTIFSTVFSSYKRSVPWKNLDIDCKKETLKKMVWGHIVSHFRVNWLRQYYPSMLNPWVQFVSNLRVKLCQYENAWLELRPILSTIYRVVGHYARARVGYCFDRAIDRTCINLGVRGARGGGGVTERWSRKQSSAFIITNHSLVWCIGYFSQR